MPDGRTPDARELAARYFEQLEEAGEKEIYLPAGETGSFRAAQAKAERVPSATPRAAASADEGPSAPGTGRPAASATEKPAARTDEKPAVGVAQKAGAGAADAPAATAPEAPEVEVVKVKLAFTDTGTTTDMFAGSTGVESCGTLDDVEKVALGCEKCELAGGRTKVVFGVGNPNARLMFIGEAPGRDEDIQGIPFVGRAGQLLNKILAAAKIERDDVYIANIIKCRPPNNRTPLTNEIEACMPYLGRQVALIKPAVICTLGLPATQTLLGIRGSMGSLRGKIYEQGDVKVIPTYHPAAALRDPKYKRPIWDDFQLVKREYERG